MVLGDLRAEGLFVSDSVIRNLYFITNMVRENKVFKVYNEENDML